MRGALSIDLSVFTNCRYAFLLSQDKWFHHHRFVTVADVHVAILIFKKYCCKQCIINDHARAAKIIPVAFQGSAGIMVCIIKLTYIIRLLFAHF